MELQRLRRLVNEIVNKSLQKTLFYNCVTKSD